MRTCRLVLALPLPADYEGAPGVLVLGEPSAGRQGAEHAAGAAATSIADASYFWIILQAVQVVHKVCETGHLLEVVSALMPFRAMLIHHPSPCP